MLRTCKSIAVMILTLLTLTNAAHVMTWVPSYFISQSKTMLNTDFGGVGMKDGITHLALQFWGPTNTSGSIAYVANGGVKGTDTDVNWFKSWGATNNAKVLLCVYNGATGWDWPTVSTTIANTTSRTALVNNLYNEMIRLGLDGIEVDLEGPQVTATQEGTNFVAFMNELSTKVRGAGKLLTCATFASQWHTPGTQHWNQLFPLCDLVTSMGYEETGINGAGDLSYARQKALAGTSSAKLALGMPTYLSTDGWLNSTTLQQVTWAAQNGVGIGIWDCSLGNGNGVANPYWRTANVWNQIKTIKGSTIPTVQFAITATATGTGTISPAGTVNVNQGANQTFAITPNSGSVLDSIKVNGTKVANATSYTFSNVQAAGSIQAWFSAVPTYTITADFVGTGTISPAGTATVTQGGSKTYTITAPQYGSVDSVKVNGTNVGKVTSYTFSNVQANGTIVAFFGRGNCDAPAWKSGTGYANGAIISYNGSEWQSLKKLNKDVPGATANWKNLGSCGATVSTWNITASAGTNGVISPAGTVVVNNGASQAFTITPNTGYNVDSVKVNGTSAGAVTSYTFSNVTANQTIAATFKIKTYTVTATAGANGTVTPAGTSTVNHGGSIAYTFTANSGYAVDSVKVNGAYVGSVTSYTVSNVTANSTVSATFKSTAVTNYTITATAGANGTITPSGAQSVASGSSKTFAIAANSGYVIDSVKVNGAYVGSVSTYTFSNVTANGTISASFKTAPVTNYTITATAGTNGTITPAGATTVASGASQTYTISANSGYVVDSVKVDGAYVGSVTSYTISNVTANKTITATFKTAPVSGSCDGVAVWDANTPWTSYAIGDRRTNANKLWEVINVAYAFYEPSGSYGSFGWKLVCDCSAPAPMDATPLLTTKTAVRADVTVSPNPVMASADQVVFTLPEGTESYRITILDGVGNVVLTKTGVDNHFAWNLLNSAGIRVSGMFKVVIRIKCADGSVKVWDSMIGVQK